MDGEQAGWDAVELAGLLAAQATRLRLAVEDALKALRPDDCKHCRLAVIVLESVSPVRPNRPKE